jgi:hypothetical protein
MMGALYFVLKALFKPHWTDAYGFVFFGVAAIFANLTLMYFFIAAAIIFAGNILYTSLALQWKKMLHLTLASGLFAVLLGPLLVSNITKLQASGSLYYGGKKNFFSDTVLSLTKAFFYGSIDAVSVLAAAAVVLLSALFVLVFTQSWNWWRSPITPLKIYLLLTAAIVAGINLHFYFLGSLF